MKDLTPLEGYTAASVMIDEMLADATKKKPVRQGNRRTAAYRSGYYDGLLFAHCMMVLGEHPNGSHNAEQIRKVLTTTKGASK